MHTIWPKVAWSERSPDLTAKDRYIILIRTKHFTERYYRDKAGWLKVSASGRTFRMTAEQVLPAVAGVKPNLNH
jgi:hypothetical protein